MFIDARPSDAIALAVAGNTPIFVEDHVLNEVAGPRPPAQLQRLAAAFAVWHGDGARRGAAVHSDSSDRHSLLVALPPPPVLPRRPSPPHPEAARTIVLASETGPKAWRWPATTWRCAASRPRTSASSRPRPTKRSPATSSTRPSGSPCGRSSTVGRAAGRRAARRRAAAPGPARRAKYLVPVYGVPIKIKGYEDVKTMYLSTAAAVDSELALLPAGTTSCPGLRNPYFGADAPFGPPWTRP